MGFMYSSMLTSFLIHLLGRANVTEAVKERRDIFPEEKCAAQLFKIAVSEEKAFDNTRLTCHGSTLVRKCLGMCHSRAVLSTKDCKCCQVTEMMSAIVKLDQCFDVAGQLVPGQFMMKRVQKPGGCMCRSCDYV